MTEIPGRAGEAGVDGGAEPRSAENAARKRGLLACGALAVAAIVIVVLGTRALYRSSLFDSNPPSRRPFTAAAWNASELQPDLELLQLRHAMAKDLEATGFLRGRSEAEIVALLGDPQVREQRNEDGTKQVLRWLLDPAWMRD